MICYETTRLQVRHLTPNDLDGLAFVEDRIEDDETGVTKVFR